MSAVPGAPRVPPHSMEAEQWVLGALLLDNSAWSRCGDVLEPADFYAPDHRAIFETIARLIAANRPADVLTVFEAGGHEMVYLNDLAAAVLGVANIRAYAEIVRERSLRRRVFQVASEMAERAMVDASETTPLAGLVDAGVMQLLALQQGSARSEPRPVASLLASYVDHVNDLYEGRTDAVATGMRDLDSFTSGGFRPGELIVIGARPSMGKTAFVLTLCRNVGRESPVLMLTMEDSERSLVARLVAAEGRINLADLRNPRRAPTSMWDGLTAGVEELSKSLIDMDDQAALTLANVRTKIQQSKRRRGRLDMVVVDYLGLMDGEGDTKNHALGAIANGLKKAAKDFNLPIVLLSQLSREADKRNGSPQMSDLRDSGDIEGAADIIGLLYRESMRKKTEENKHHAELNVAKQKNGETGSLSFYFDGATQRFLNWDGLPPSRMGGVQ